MLNADVLITGNLYAYSANNPIFYCDRDGYALCTAFEDSGFGNPMAALTGGVGGGGGVGWHTYTYAGVMQSAADDGGRARRIAEAQEKFNVFMRSVIDGISLVVGSVFSFAAQAAIWIVRHSVVPLLSLAYGKLAGVLIEIASLVPGVGIPVVGLLLVLGYGAVLSLGDVLQRGLNSLLFGDDFTMPTEEELIDMVKSNIVTDIVGGLIGKLADGAALVWGGITTLIDVLWNEMPSAE